jgi:riboflavin kinase/FMN adenylyltransferase
MQIISWEEYIGNGDQGSGIRDQGLQTVLPDPLAITIGVFDGVHMGHQALLRQICGSPYIPTVVTFRENPIKTLAPGANTQDIITLEKKLQIMNDLGVQLAVLIDFSENFSKISGRDFIDLLLGRQPVKLIVIGENFRCGQGLDTGAAEIQSLAAARGIEARVAPPVMDGGQPVSSSRIRQAQAEGRVEEAERLLNWPSQLKTNI